MKMLVTSRYDYMKYVGKAKITGVKLSGRISA